MSKTRVAPPYPPTVYPQGVGPPTELVRRSVGANPSGVRSADEYMPDVQAINRALGELRHGADPNRQAGPRRGPRQEG
jgi:hypothetical protein